MIKIRIRNAGHEIDVQFPISENKLYQVHYICSKGDLTYTFGEK